MKYQSFLGVAKDYKLKISNWHKHIARPELMKFKMLNNHPHPVLKLKAEHYGNIIWIGMFFAVIDILTSSFSMSTCKYWHQTEYEMIPKTRS